MERRKKFNQTLFIDINDTEAVKDAAEKIRAGEVVAFPTETVYGLGANAFDTKAVDKIFEAKGRPGDNPLICHIWNKDQIEELTSEVTPAARKLIDSFMPGPITVIMRKSDKVPSNVTAGLDTVGVRMPSSPAAAKFLELCGVPVAAPSANLSGSPSPTRAMHVMDDMYGYIYAVIDGGDSDFGLESTVVDCTGDAPVILRPGAVTADAILKVTGYECSTGKLAEGETPKAPGMKYRHYAPNANVEIINLPDKTEITGDELDGEDHYEIPEIDLEALSDEEKQKVFDIAAPFIFRVKSILAESPVMRIGIFCGAETEAAFKKLNDKIMLSHLEFFTYGRSTDVSAASHFLFEGLRDLDIQDVGTILCQGFTGNGVSRAYMNRLGKAALKTGEVTAGMQPDKRRLRTSLPLYYFDETYTMSVLFVCDDNKCLSPACETFLRDLIWKEVPFVMADDRNTGVELYAESCGLTAMDNLQPDPGMVDAVKEISGKDMGGHKTLRADMSLFDANDLILTIRDEQAYDILNKFPELDGKVYSLSSYIASKGLVIKSSDGRTVGVSIPNPKGQNRATYVHTAKALKAWIELLFPYVLKDLGVKRI